MTLTLPNFIGLQVYERVADEGHYQHQPSKGWRNHSLLRVPFSNHRPRHQTTGEYRSGQHVLDGGHCLFVGEDYGFEFVADPRCY